MAILSWREEYSVGVGLIDEEHKRLIAMINKAYDSIADMREHEVFEELVEDMRVYAAEHFRTEERLMAEYGYPGAKAHKMAHDDFIIRASVTNSMLAKGERADSSQIFSFLAEWLNKHIMGTDKQLGVFLNTKGVR
jgi:hemerythrin